MLESIWDDANLKGVVRRAAYGEGDTVDGDTVFHSLFMRLLSTL